MNHGYAASDAAAEAAEDADAFGAGLYFAVAAAAAAVAP